MILTVTLNTAIDKTLAVPNFRLGRRHRTVEQTTMPGGKGVNVARVLKTLGAPVIATGLAGGATGTRLVDQLTQVSVLSDFVRIREVRRLGVTTVVDTDGDPLRRSVRAEPDVISPNVLEAEELVGHEFNDDEDHCIAVREMVELGARESIMTAPDGCYAYMLPSEPGGTPCLYRVRVRPGAIEPRATVGSGDAFLAGFVAARYNGLGTEECLINGVACGAQSTQHLGAGLVDRGQVERLLGDIEVERPAISAEVT